MSAAGEGSQEAAGEALPDQQESSDLSRTLIAQQVAFHGPLPPPEVLARYDEVHPGAAELILRSFEQETLHRRELEQRSVAAQIAELPHERVERRRGQWMGFILAIAALVAAVLCAFFEATVAAGVIGGSTVLGLVSVFVLGRLWSGRADERPVDDDSSK